MNIFSETLQAVAFVLAGIFSGHCHRHLYLRKAIYRTASEKHRKPGQAANREGYLREAEQIKKEGPSYKAKMRLISSNWNLKRISGKKIRSSSGRKTP